MIQFILSLYAYLILCFALGYFPSRLLWQHQTSSAETERSGSRTLLIFAFPLGFILINLTIYLAASTLTTGVGLVAPIALAGLLLASGSLIVFRQGEMRKLLHLLREHGRFLLFLLTLIVPLSAIHLLWPMSLYGWQTSYTNGTDGAAYVYLGQYLQDHGWHPGVITDVVPFYYIGRPLTSYFPADGLALFPITFFQAQSLAAAMVSFFSALILGWLAQYFFEQKGTRRPLFLAALVLGIFCFHFQLYWDRSFMSHYFSLLPFLLTPVYFFLPERAGTRFLFLFVLFLAAITVYSIGLSLIQFALIAFGLAALWLSRRIPFKRLVINGATTLAAFAASNALLYKTEAPFFLGNMARGYDPSLKTWQNLTIKFGLLPTPLPSEDKFFLLAMLLIAGLTAYAFARAFINAKHSPIYLAMLLGTTSISLVAVLRDKYFFLDKALVYFVPLLLLPLLADIKPWPDLKRRIATIPLAVIFLVFAYNGYFMLDRFYYTIAEARSSFVSGEMIETKQDLIARYHPKKIFAIDNLLERHHLTRVLFHDVDWQQNTALHVWQEFGINPKNPPPSFKNYDFDLLLIGKPAKLRERAGDSETNGAGDSIWHTIRQFEERALNSYQGALSAGVEKPILDPVDYTANHAWKIAELPGHDIYSSGASLVDFDLSWEIVPGGTHTSFHSRLSDKQGAEIVFVNGGSHRWLEIDFHMMHGGTAIADVATPANLFTLDGRPLPISGKHKVRVSCPDLCRERINRIKISPPPGVGVAVSGVRFGA